MVIMTFISLPAVATNGSRCWQADILGMFFSASSSRFGGSIALRSYFGEKSVLWIEGLIARPQTADGETDQGGGN
jgi:hypothetical protein